MSLLGLHNQKEERIVYPMIDQAVGGEERSGVFLKMQQTPSRAGADCDLEQR
jgi:iron-sulfur cluster repair protein YtfE (RIC family)